MADGQPERIGTEYDPQSDPYLPDTPLGFLFHHHRNTFTRTPVDGALHQSVRDPENRPGAMGGADDGWHRPALSAVRPLEQHPIHLPSRPHAENLSMQRTGPRSEADEGPAGERGRVAGGGVGRRGKV
jgi:hypothetical protein